MNRYEELLQTGKALLAEATKEKRKVEEKKCPKCGFTKPLLEGFGWSRTQKIYYSHCKACRSASAVQSNKGIKRVPLPKRFTRPMLRAMNEGQKARYLELFREVTARMAVAELEQQHPGARQTIENVTKALNSLAQRKLPAGTQRG